MSDCSPLTEKSDGSSEEPCCGPSWFASGTAQDLSEENVVMKKMICKYKTTIIGQSSPSYANSMVSGAVPWKTM